MATHAKNFVDNRLQLVGTRVHKRNCLSFVTKFGELFSLKSLNLELLK